MEENKAEEMTESTADLATGAEFEEATQTEEGIPEPRVEEISGADIIQFKKPKIDWKGWKEWLGTDEAVRWVYLLFGFCAVLMLMVITQFQTDAICCGDWDGYYHIRWSQLLWENFSQLKWLPEFKWLPLTVLGPQDYADHHFLFHVMQIPFLWFFEPVMAAKVAAVFYATIAITSVYWLMFRYQIDNLLLWFGALVTCATPFFYRMNMAKAPPLTIIISVIGIYLLFERKYKWLLPLMFVFVWTYSMFPILFIAAMIWAGIIAWNERKFEWQPLAYTGGGMLLGNIINPYFPTNLKLFFEHFFTKFKVDDFAVPVGGEWYPYNGVELMTSFLVALIAMWVGYVLFRPRNGKLPEKSTFFLIFVTILLASQFRSKRFAEYFPPFAILFAAFSWKEFFTRQVVELPDEFKRDIEPLLDADKKTQKQTNIELARQVAVWVIGLAFIGIVFLNFKGLHRFGINQDGLLGVIAGNEGNNKYKSAMQWITDNVPEGERIYNANWDDFPKMFFLDTKHTYVYGLDPNYLYSKNPDLYKLIGEINAGKVDDAAPQIRDRLGSKIIFSDAKENGDMIAKALESGWVDKVYQDDEAVILRIRDQKGEAPKESLDEPLGKDEPPPSQEEVNEAEKELENEEKAAGNKTVNVNANDDDEPEENTKP